MDQNRIIRIARDKSPVKKRTIGSPAKDVLENKDATMPIKKQEETRMNKSYHNDIEKEMW